jgi:Zn-dependent peptidase ImmA (M78 family)
MQFIGSELRLARVFNGFTLEQVGELTGKTRQYLHRCEAGLATPTEAHILDLASALRVKPQFFLTSQPSIAEEQFHFRKLMSTKALAKQAVMARGEMFVRLSLELEKLLKFPRVNVPDFGDATSDAEVEAAAEACRREWDLGMGPIDNMNRLAENLGVLITSFHSLSREVDALSVATARPIIVRNEAKESVCRQRSDIGHELGHFVLHTGIATGSASTEHQANRFSSALLVPRTMMLKLFPRPKNNRIDWQGIREFKKTWKVSKALILYRANKLGLLTDAQYKSGAITLRTQGETAGERDDYLVPREGPEVLERSFSMLATRKNISGSSIADLLEVEKTFLDDLVGFKTPHTPSDDTRRPHLTLVG